MANTCVCLTVASSRKSTRIARRTTNACSCRWHRISGYGQLCHHRSTSFIAFAVTYIHASRKHVVPIIFSVCISAYSTRSSATAKSTARPSCLVGVFYDIYRETNNRSTAYQPLVRNWPWNLWNSAKKTQIMAITPFKVIQGHPFWYQSKAHMRLPISD